MPYTHVTAAPHFPTQQPLLRSKKFQLVLSQSLISTFPQFSKLPTELRLRIWRYAQPGQRFIHLLRGKCDCLLPDSEICYEYSSRIFHPTLLAVNHESRTETLKSYPMIHTPHGYPLAFNNDRDIIRQTHVKWGGGIRPTYFQEPNFTTSKETNPSKLTVKSVAISESALRALRHHTTVHYLKNWASFDEVIIILSPFSSLNWPQSQTGEKMRTLLPGVPIKQEEGWGDAEVQEGFLRVLEKTRCKSTSLRRGAGIPIVKIAQWMIEEERDPFCVPLTPLSLRK